MQTIKIYYMFIHSINESKIESLSQLIRDKLSNFTNKSAKLLSLSGLLLLDKALKDAQLGGIDNFEISTYSNGKPYIKELKNFHYNISHSHDIAVLAVSNEEIGIDVEKMLTPNLNVAKRFFTPAEIDYITNSLAPNLAFYRIWVAKESFMKLTGLGFKLPMSKFSVSFDDKDIPHFKQSVYPKPVFLHELTLNDQYKIAISHTYNPDNVDITLIETF